MIKRRPLPTQEILNQLLCYEQETGKLFWRSTGKEAFTTLNSRGYRVGYLFRKSYLAHRVIFKLVYGLEPDHLDHISHVRNDNRLDNLRIADEYMNKQNSGHYKNNTSGALGVVWDKPCQKWKAQIWTGGRSGGKMIYLGLFDTVEEAAIARKSANLEYGYHKNHGKKNVG